MRVLRGSGRKLPGPIGLLLFLSLLVSGPLAAQDSGPPSGDGGTVRLDPDTAVELAVRNNLVLQMTRVGTEATKRASDLSWNRFIPTVDVSGTMLRLNNAPEGITIPLPPQLGGPMSMGASPQWMVRTSLSASLNFNFAMFTEMDKLRLDYEKGLISYEKARAQLERDVRKAYHSMLLLQENVALLHGSLENAERQVQMAQANFNTGRAPELTLLQAQVAMENLRPVIDQAEGGLRLSRMQFALFLGLPPGDDFVLSPVPTELSSLTLDTAALIARAASGQPDIRELRQDILIAMSIRKSTGLRLFTPNLILSWSVDPALSGDPWEGKWFGEDRWKQSSGALSLTVAFRLNGLLPFGQERQGLKGLDDQLRSLGIRLEYAIRGTEIEIHNLVLSLERLQVNMDALAQTVALAERSFSLTEQAYRAGLVDLFQVQSAEQSLRQARVQLYEQQFNYLNGLIDLEYALGIPFGTLFDAE